MNKLKRFLFMLLPEGVWFPYRPRIQQKHFVKTRGWFKREGTVIHGRIDVMLQKTWLEKVREWLGGVAFDVFLWSVRMTEDEYRDAIIRENELSVDENESDQNELDDNELSNPQQQGKE